MAIVNHKILLTLENDWIETGNGKGRIIRRIQTPEEHLEMYCECCKEETGEFEVTVKTFFIEKEDILLLCKKCLQLLSKTIINDENFNSLFIQRL